MGQGVDLPDPLNKPPVDPNSNADELLAQLAGEEIDRLLAEAEVERAPVVATAAPTKGVSATMAPMTANAAEGVMASASEPANPGADKQLDALFAEIKAEADAEVAQKTGGAATGAATSRSTSEVQPITEEAPSVAGEVDTTHLTPLSPGTTVRTRIEVEIAAPVAEAGSAGTAEVKASAASPSPNATGNPMTERAAATSPFTMEAPPEEVGSEEKQTLTADIAVAEIATSAAALAAEADDPLPAWRSINWRAWLVRPLEWMNMPLTNCSDALRDMLGKVAIVTLLHATAVLLYVYLFRQK